MRLVAVTKSVSPATAAALVEAGAGELGENRTDELERKHAFLEQCGLRPSWHFIGHLQRNKARRVVRLADAIHAVDSPRLLETLARLCDEEGRRPALFLQVKLADETTKGGLAPAEVPAALERAAAFGLPVAGLMTMAPLVAAAEAAGAARATFAALARLRAGLPAAAFVAPGPLLSMGMSEDFEVAIQEGADLVRVGSALFVPGPRTPEAGG